MTVYVAATESIILVRPAEPGRTFIYHTSRDCPSLRRVFNEGRDVDEVAKLPAWATNARKCLVCS